MVPTRKLLWLAARIAALTTLGVMAIVFLSSWVVSIIIGGVTIVAVAVDGWMLARSQADQVAHDPSSPPSDRLTVDLSRRR